MTAQELTLRPGKVHWTLMLVGGVVFAAGSVWMIRSGVTGWGAAGVVLFGLATVVALVQLLTPLSYLRLTPTGFTVSNLGQRRATSWDEVDSFSVEPNYIRGFKVGERVWVGYSSSYLAGHRIARAIVETLGYSLPDNYGMKAKDLAALMNGWRDRFARSTA